MRPYCSDCLYPQSRCLCSHVSLISSDYSIDILQHPSEQKAAKNTARLVSLCLPELQIWRGENASDFCALQASIKDNSTKDCALIYPSPDSMCLSLASPEPSLNSLERPINSPEPSLNSPEPAIAINRTIVKPEVKRDCEVENNTGLSFTDSNKAMTGLKACNARPSEDANPITRLLFIDATWRKAYKMYQLNPWLQQLPHYALPEREQAYRIRKAPKNYQLSTLEAIAWSLDLLGDQHAARQLLTLFEHFQHRFQGPQ